MYVYVSYSLGNFVCACVCVHVNACAHVHVRVSAPVCVQVCYEYAGPSLQYPLGMSSYFHVLHLNG